VQMKPGRAKSTRAGAGGGGHPRTISPLSTACKAATHPGLVHRPSYDGRRGSRIETASRHPQGPAPHRMSNSNLGAHPHPPPSARLENPPFPTGAGGYEKRGAHAARRNNLSRFLEESAPMVALLLAGTFARWGFVRSLLSTLDCPAAAALAVRARRSSRRYRDSWGLHLIALAPRMLHSNAEYPPSSSRRTCQGAGPVGWTRLVLVVTSCRFGGINRRGCTHGV
jgi:hypothetical protein